MFEQGDRVWMVGADGHPKYGFVQYVHTDSDGEARVIGVETDLPVKIGTDPRVRTRHTFYARGEEFYLSGQKSVYHNRLNPTKER